MCIPSKGAACRKAWWCKRSKRSTGWHEEGAGRREYGQGQIGQEHVSCGKEFEFILRASSR